MNSEFVVSKFTNDIPRVKRTLHRRRGGMNAPSAVRRRERSKPLDAHESKDHEPITRFVRDRVRRPVMITTITITITNNTVVTRRVTSCARETGSLRS